ncbi:MAG: mitochondrial fission ELM1 family protein [Hyphomicrobiaceae bacterium]
MAQTAHGPNGAAGTARPLAGARAWLITDGKTGMDVQVAGVAEELGVLAEVKRVDPKGLWRFAAPWGPVQPSDRLGKPGSAFMPPWPDIAIATGRLSIPYIRAIRKAAGPRTFTVVLQDPKTGPDTADLIWVPAHDRRRGFNVITTLTAPHSFTAERFARLRQSPPPAIAALPAPRIAVVLGGKNAVYRFTEEDDQRFGMALKSLAALGVSFMVTPSRRTHKRLLDVVTWATAGSPRMIWDGSGDNPYPDFLAQADSLIVTADSVNMTGEATATGRPVYVFAPSGGSAKFSRFHEALHAYGATRPLPASFERLESWSYAPLLSAHVIAAEIEQRWSKRRQALPGLFHDGRKTAQD